MTDKYEDQRFERSCPTCGQEFMAERFDHARSAALEEAARCVMQCNEDQMLSKPEAVEVAAVIRALGTAAAPVPSGWQPITTAPKDGTCVMLHAPATTLEGKAVEQRVTMGQWEEWVKTASEYHGTTGEYLGQSVQDGGASWISWDGGFTEENPPTHWMPIPVAPQVPA